MGPWKISLPTRAQLVAREIFALQNIEAGMLSYFVLYQWFSLFIFLYVPRYTTKRQLQPLSFRRQNISQLEYIQCWLYLTLELVKGEPLQWEWFDHIVITIDSFCICLSPTVKYNETEWSIACHRARMHWVTRLDCVGIVNFYTAFLLSKEVTMLLLSASKVNPKFEKMQW